MYVDWFSRVTWLAKSGGRKVTELSVSEFSYWNVILLLQSSDTLKEMFHLVQALFS